MGKIYLEGADNTRDLGGLKTTEGAVIKDKQLIRRGNDLSRRRRKWIRWRISSHQIPSQRRRIARLRRFQRNHRTIT